MEKIQTELPLSAATPYFLITFPSQLAFEGGPAVFMARAIIDVEYDDELTGRYCSQLNNLTDVPDPELVLYPNPSSGKIIIQRI